MSRWAISVLTSLLLASLALAQDEVVVTWSLQPAVSSPPPFYQFIGDETSSEMSDLVARWLQWDEGESLRTESSHEMLRVAVWRWPRAWTLVLWNGAPQKAKVTIRGELPAGVYTVERLRLGPGAMPLALERRNGLQQRAAGGIQRTEWLDGHSGLALRFVERGQVVGETLSALRQSIWRSEVSRGVLSRLAALLREAGSHWYQVRASLRRGDQRMSARGVHRMLFLVSGMRAASSKYPGAEQVTAQAEQLLDALSELSSAVLSPVICVQQQGRSLRVQVVNAGGQVWRALRLTAPQSDAVVLANMKPMERAETTFTLPTEEEEVTIVASILFNGGYSRLKMTSLPTKPAAQKEEQP
ncbi:MAG: hypothetical protein RMM06_04260 [Armatimonadota bacterium]|nr:hypothetical protein [bacterium]MDW8289910.1 hypothetical protein [Armatimonadota bacterium]